MDSSKIHSLGCNLQEPSIRHVLKNITTLKSLAFPVVCLPDLHLKKRTEGPCSFAAATSGTIVPELTAPSVGCGMGVIATSLNRQDINNKFFQEFYKHMREHLGPRLNTFQHLLLWLHIMKRPRNLYDLSIAEFEDIIKYGAQSAVRRYRLPEATLTHVEYEGNVFTESELQALNVKSLLPPISYRSGRHDLGYGFKGNHFLEIQYIEEIFDQQLAQKWQLQKDQILIMYHGGGGAVSYHIGRYFGNRKKNTFSQKFQLLFFKILFHFGKLSEWKYAIQRLRYYFFPKSFQEIPIDTHEGARLLLATKASLNYSYGFRMAIMRRILDSLSQTLPDKHPSGRLLWDGAHNAISEETVFGKNVMVHRHTANRVFEGRPVVISGFNTTNSYIAVGMKQGEDHLFASDHGAGVTIQKYQKEKRSGMHPRNHTTIIFKSKEPSETVQHITNEGVNAVMKTLEETGITRPVVSVRPLAVFKG